MDIEKIKRAIKKAIQGTTEGKLDCENCKAEKTFFINPKTEKMTCKTCRSEYKVPDEFYISLYKQLKEIGVVID